MNNVNDIDIKESIDLKIQEKEREIENIKNGNTELKTTDPQDMIRSLEDDINLLLRHKEGKEELSESRLSFLLGQKMSVSYFESLNKIKRDNIKLSEYILDVFDKKYGVVRSKNNEQLYFFNGKYYEIQSFKILEKKLHSIFKRNGLTGEWSKNRAKEIICSMSLSDLVKEVDMDNHDNMICLNNGVLDLDTLEFYKHSPDRYFSFCSKVDYDPKNNDTPVFAKFLMSLFADSGDWENGFNLSEDGKKCLENVLKICGYLLYPQNKMESMFFFIGGGANGKSLLLSVVEMFFDKKNISYLSLDALSRKNHDRELLLDSRVNISTEQKGHKINSEEIKKIVSGETIILEKKYGDSIEFKPVTKIIFASNDIPYLDDTSYGSTRRRMMLEFKNTFVSKKNLNNKMPNVFEKKDKNWLIHNIKKELPAILNLFVEGIQLLRRDNWELKDTINSRNIEEQYLNKTDRLRMFLMDRYEADRSDNPAFVSTLEVFNWFKAYHEETTHGRLSGYTDITIGKKIKEVFGIEGVTKTTQGKRCRGYFLKEKIETDDDWINENLLKSDTEALNNERKNE